MSYTTYLSHHGVKGQKWGDRNGPPYPLNDITKAIAYRGGEMSDGRKVVNFTRKDVKKARRLVNKNMKTMTSDEIKEYKSRLILEREMGEILGTDTTDKLVRGLKNKAVEAVTDSVKQSGTKMLTNLEVNAVGAAVEAAFGPDVRNMITDGITKYQASESKYKKQQDKIKNKGDKQAKTVSLSTAYNNATDEEIKEVIKNMILENGDYVSNKASSKSSEESKQESPKQEQPKQKESSDTPKYEKVQGEIIDDTPKSNNDHEYVDKEKVNGEWRYYYEPTRYESWNSDYLLPGSTSSKSSKKKRKKK